MMKQSGFGGMPSPAQLGGSGPPPSLGGGGGMMERNPMTPGALAALPMGGGGGGGGPGTPIMAPQGGQQQLMVAQQQPPGSSISLALLIDFIVQRTYHDLTVLAELLPRKTDMERKQEIFNFSARTRLLAVRLLGLVKWASSAAKVDKSVQIMGFLEKQSMLFVETADVLSRMARETLVHARLPNFHIPAAVEVLTTGTYNRLPNCIRERIVPPDAISVSEKKFVLSKLNQVILHRLVTTELPSQMRNLKIEQGRVVCRVENEFEVSLTVLGDAPNSPWRIIDIDVLVEDKDIGDGMSLVHPLQINYMHSLAQSRIDNSSAPLRELYDILHAFAQSLQLEVLYSQVLKLCRDRLGDFLTVEEYTVGRSIILGYWKELSSLDPKAELGYRLVISVDFNDPAQPLGVSHQPPLSSEEISATEEGLKNNQLEKILVQTVYLRSKNRLTELRKEVEHFLGMECTLQGSPPILSIPILTNCFKSEQLLVSVNIHTGSYLVHIPQFEPSPPVVNEIQQALNTVNPNPVKIKALLSQLRYWVTERRCEKTLQHLPASSADKITLLKWDENPILGKIGPNRLTIKFQKHPYAILIVEFKEKEDHSNEMDYFFYLIMVKKASADENEDLPAGATVGGAVPKFYLKPMTTIPLDTFAATHGPFTDVDVVDPSERLIGKRRYHSNGQALIEPSTKKFKHPPYFVPELAHIVALCDERLPFGLMMRELSNREMVHGGCMDQANGSCLAIPILRFPMELPGIPQSTSEKLHNQLNSAYIRYQTQLRGFRTWNLEIKFGAISGSTTPGVEKPVSFAYDMIVSSEEHIPKVVDSMIDDWTGIAKLFHLILKSNCCRQFGRNSPISVKSFTWNKLVISYGPNKGAVVTIIYSITEKVYKLSFGGSAAHNPHILLRVHLQQYINSNIGSLDGLMKLLNETYEPLHSLSKLPTTPQLGVMYSRPQIPVQTFVLVPHSVYHVRAVYCSVYCLDVTFQRDGLVSIRDGAYSQFDKTSVVGDFSPTQGLKAFLSKYVDENAVFRRRSQSEDDNPPSPISTLLEMDHNVGTPGGGSASPFMTAKPSSPAPGRSNPHTPASPHIPQPTPTGYSPATSMANLASPPSLSHLSQQSPNPSASMLPHPVPSPSAMLPAPSPSGGPLSVPTPSPNPNPHHNTSSHGPASAMASLGSTSHPSPFFHADSSPAPAQSPWGAAGSPGMPRPSPARVGHSPQSGQMENRVNLAHNRVLPQRSWAGAIPTILTHDALDMLCTPSADTAMANSGLPCRPLERFLGCSYLRRQLQRIVQSEDHLHLLNHQEPGVILFRSDTMQFRVSLDPNYFQSLHIKITPAMENQLPWNPEELQLLETFFMTKVVCPPFRPNGLSAFLKMISLPARIIRDCIQIIRLQLNPSIIEQHNWKWGVQLCLTVPPSAMPIIPQGMSSIVTSQSKILLYLLLTRAQSDVQPMEIDGNPTGGSDSEKVPFIVVPLIHEITTNMTQLAEKRAMGPPSPEYAIVSQQLRRFSDFNPGNMECSIFPSVQELLANLAIPPDGAAQPPNQPPPPIQQPLQPQPMPPVPVGGPMVRPPMGQPMMNPGPPFSGPHGGMGPGSGPMM